MSQDHQDPSKPPTDTTLAPATPDAGSAVTGASEAPQHAAEEAAETPRKSPPTAAPKAPRDAHPSQRAQTTKPTIHDLLRHMVQQNASDLHITTGTPPHLRIDGDLQPMELQALTHHDTESLCMSLLNQEQRDHFAAEQELDFSFSINGLARFRASIYRQRNSTGGAFRIIPFRIRSLQELGLPKVVSRLARKPRGLVLVTGPAGSGKSTTLAALIDQINRTRKQHIVTIEDPIEFIHPHQSCIINQREVGTDTSSFAKAMRQVLRLDPDVILVGEIRDLESLEASLSLAETGHLVLATLHTNSAIHSIHRVIDFFPHHQQSQARLQLSFVLEGVLCQQLIPRVGGGRALALEMMFPTQAIRHLIREDKIHQIYSQIQVGQLANGMQTLNRALVELYERGFIEKHRALASSSEPAELQQLLAQTTPIEAERPSHPLLRNKR